MVHQRNIRIGPESGIPRGSLRQMATTSSFSVSQPKAFWGHMDGLEGDIVAMRSIDKGKPGDP